nr:RING-H2 finger protein ATL38-like [Ipomoea batatas]
MLAHERGEKLKLSGNSNSWFGVLLGEGRKMISSETNLVMTVIGFAVSTMFIVFVCTRLICARIQLSSTRRSLARASGSDLSILERGLHGLEPLAVSKFPTKKYSDVFFTSAEDTQMHSSLADYQQEDSLRILPFCGHYFHATCIDVWLQQHSTCPVCRISLREVTEKKRFMPPLFSSAVRCHHAMASMNVNPTSAFVPGIGSHQRHTTDQGRTSPHQTIEQ